MSVRQLPDTIFVHVPYIRTGEAYESLRNSEVFIEPEKDRSDHDGALVTKAKDESLVEMETLNFARRYIYNYPTVYVVYSREKNRYTSYYDYTVYVGETNDIRRRTDQHARGDAKARKDWKTFANKIAEDPESVRQYIIGNEHFNKSLTLDIENRLMHYLLGSMNVRHLNNRRTNAQGDYYTKDEFDRLFSDIWQGLYELDDELFPSEESIWNSALFKASPFHELSGDQIEAEDAIMKAVQDALSDKTDSDKSKLIFVQGAAGTGKTVLLSHLFCKIARGWNEEESEEEDSQLDGEVLRNATERPAPKAYLIVNHNQQINVYNQIATKLGLQNEAGVVVLKPSQFINKHSKKTAQKRGNPEEPQGKVDIVLVDEAHLLLTQGSQGYSGKNMLHDLLRRAKVVVAVFDPKQILQSAQQWSKEDLAALFPDGQLTSKGKGSGEMESFQPLHYWGDDYLLSHIRLRQQFRINASEPVIQWVDKLAGGANIGPIPIDDGKDENGKSERKPYEIKVFDSPVELFKAIKDKDAEESKQRDGGQQGQGLSRVVATYDWAYNSNPKVEPDTPDKFWDVEMHRDEDGVWRMGPGQVERRGYFDTDDDGAPLNPDANPDYFCHPWNYQLKRPGGKKSLSTNEVWAEAAHTINEVGSTFSIQGFDLNYVGVIIGPSVKYRDGQIIFDKDASKNSKATNMRDGSIDYSRENLRNELNVLLKRGVHGLYLFAVDPELQRALKVAEEAGHGKMDSQAQ